MPNKRIEARAIKLLRSGELDIFDLSNHDPDVHIVIFPEIDIGKNNLFPKLTNEQIEEIKTYKLIRIWGGDGTIAVVINALMQAFENDLANLPPLVLEGGGTANTLRTALIENDFIDADFNDDLQNKREGIIQQFPLEKFIVRAYRPLQLEQDGQTAYAAYLAGFGHLGISGTQIKEGIAYLAPSFTVKHIQTIYPVSGLTSLILFPIGERPHLENDQSVYAALDITTIGRYASLRIGDPVEPSLIRVLMIRGRNNLECFTNLFQTLTQAGFKPDAIPALQNRGVLTIEDISEISVFPGNLGLLKTDNFLPDGELKRLGPQAVTVKRADYPFLIVVPKN